MISLSPDIVVVSTSSGAHLKNIKEIFEYGNPKIICEKPLSLK